MTQKIDTISEDSIKRLVDAFYARIRQDRELGPIFDRTIGTSEKEWQLHLETMYRFWSSIMLASGRFHGAPMQKHQALPAFDLGLFERWLMLFEKTTNDLHTKEIALQYQLKSQNIAKNLRHAMEQTGRF